jgi:hypothetical protein
MAPGEKPAIPKLRCRALVQIKEEKAHIDPVFDAKIMSCIVGRFNRPKGEWASCLGVGDEFGNDLSACDAQEVQ